MIEQVHPPAGVPSVPSSSPSTGRWRLLAVIISFFLFILAFMAILAAVILAWINSPLILPGVTVMGVHIGGLQTTPAGQALTAAWDQQTITIDTGGEAVVFMATDLGFSLNAAETIRQAHALGRRAETITPALLSLTEGMAIQPVWQFDPGVAEQRLQALAAQVAAPAQNAGVIIRQGRAEAVPPSPGREVDVAATLAWIQAQPAEVLASGRVELVVQPTTPIFADPAPIVAEINTHLENSITLRAYDPIFDETFSWTVAPERWGEWILLSVPPEDPSSWRWQVDPQQVQYFLETETASLSPGRYLDLNLATAAMLDSIPAGTYAAETRVYHAAREHIVQPGETLSSIAFDTGIPYPWIQEANPDLGDTLHAGQKIVIPSPDVMLPLPVVVSKRIVVSLSEQQLWAYEDGELLWNWAISSGLASSPTAPGIFQIQTHEENAYAGNWDLWMPFFMGIYRPVPGVDFMNGFHGFPTRNGSTLLWTGDLGHPVTYGCLLLSTENAQILYDWAETGVIVAVVP